MSNHTPALDLEPRPLLFALWFRALVVLFAAAVVAVLVVPAVLHWAGATVFETIAAAPPSTSPSKEPAIGRAVVASLSQPLVLAALGLLAGLGAGWLAHARLRPSRMDAQPVPPPADEKWPRLEECAAIARKFVEELESLADILRGPSPTPELVSRHQGPAPVPGLNAVDRDAA